MANFQNIVPHLLIVLFATFQNVFCTVVCNYYPTFSLIPLSTRCEKFCCSGYPKTEYDACCYTQINLWWISLIVIGTIALVIIILVILRMFGCIKSFPCFSRGKRNGSVNPHSTRVIHFQSPIDNRNHSFNPDIMESTNLPSINGLGANEIRSIDPHSAVVNVPATSNETPFEPPEMYKYDLDSPPSYDTVERTKKEKK